MKLIIVIVATLLYYTFHVLEDDIDSKKEALIKSLRKQLGQVDKLPFDLVGKELWHFYNWVKIAIYGLLVSYLYANTFLEGMYLICFIATLRIVYFNPLISLKLGSTFFHLGQGKWESLFAGKEKLYYFINLTITLLCLYLLISKTY